MGEQVDVQDFVDVAEGLVTFVGGVAKPVGIIIFTDGPQCITEAQVIAVRDDHRGTYTLDEFAVWYDPVSGGLVRQYVDATEAARLREHLIWLPDVYTVVFDVVGGEAVNGRRCYTWADEQRDSMFDAGVGYGG